MTSRSSEPPSPTSQEEPRVLLWPVPDADIDAIQVIDLGAPPPVSSVLPFDMSRVRPARRLYLVPARSPYQVAPPPWFRPPERRWPRIWPIAVGSLALELVESRALPKTNAPVSMPTAPVAIARTVAPPPALPLTNSVPDRVIPSESLERPRAPVAPRRTRHRAVGQSPVHREPARHEPVRREALRHEPPGHEPLRNEPRSLSESQAEQFVPPRVSQSRIASRRPTPFPAARGSRTRLALVVDAAGRVESARLLSEETPYYDARALEAVRAWRFEPARLAGRPVRATVDVEVRAP
jgi:TonB family protein